MINKWLNIQTKLYQKKASDTAEIHILQKNTKNFNKNQIKLILKIVFLKKTNYFCSVLLIITKLNFNKFLKNGRKTKKKSG